MSLGLGVAAGAAPAARGRVGVDDGAPARCCFEWVVSGDASPGGGSRGAVDG